MQDVEDLWVTDGLWKLTFAHCMYEVKVSTHIVYDYDTHTVYDYYIHFIAYCIRNPNTKSSEYMCQSACVWKGLLPNTASC